MWELKLKRYHEESLWYFSSTIIKDREIQENVKYELEGWNGDFSSKVLCDWHVPTKIEVRNLKIAIKLAMTCEEKYWTIKKQHI